MKTLKAFPNVISYQIELTRVQWLRLQYFDNYNEWPRPKKHQSEKKLSQNLQDNKDFSKELDELGVIAVEFNGHFGPNFFFEVNSGTDVTLISNYLSSKLCEKLK
jgi:hypothetical protein